MNRNKTKSQRGPSIRPSSSSATSQAVLKRLTTLEKAVVQISQCRTVESAARAGSDLARSRTGTQAASVYLLNDHGRLARIAIVGLDKEGEPIPRDWFPGESHAPGESITGKVLPSLEDQGSGLSDDETKPKRKNTTARAAFGRLSIWTKDQQAIVSPESGKKYRELLGDLKSAAGVPLNGPHRSFGVLEILNKSWRYPKIGSSSFDEDDLFWLWHVATVLSARISFLRRKEELTLLASIAGELSEPYSARFDERESFQRIANLLVSPSTCFRACIVRRSQDGGKLAVLAKAGEVDWSKWTDKLNDKEDRVARQTFSSGQIEIISDIRKELSRFENRDWIENNELRAYVCLPLSKPGRALGTISLFTSFFYVPDEDDREFLENVQAVASGLANAGYTVQDLERTQDRLEDLQLLQVAQTRQVSYAAAIEQRLHRYKNDFQQIIGSLQPIVDGRKTGRKAIEAALIPEIINAEQRVEEIKKEFQETKFQSFNLNHLVQELTKQFSQRFSRSVVFTTEMDWTLPDLEANESEFREILSNLLVNAVSAIKEADRSGEVQVHTRLREELGTEFIELSVQDDGVGIPREVLGRIYERNFTTRETAGTGMGLFIVYNLVQKYLGDMKVETSVGSGSCFRVLIPRVPWESGHD
jgi:signal transduction histidine kinase